VHVTFEENPVDFPIHLKLRAVGFPVICRKECWKLGAHKGGIDWLAGFIVHRAYVG
jgi:hypothetical protein